MDKEEMLKELLEEGYSEEEALDEVDKRLLEQEQFEWFIFQHIIDNRNKWSDRVSDRLFYIVSFIAQLSAGFFMWVVAGWKNGIDCVWGKSRVFVT